MVFKTDITKAYDSVSWSYLDQVMQDTGFGGKWRAWIMECLKSSKSSILVNGSPTNEFQHGRGLRQGDPIAPFLFTLVMEGLNIAIEKAIRSDSFRGATVGGGIFLYPIFFLLTLLFFLVNGLLTIFSI